LLGLHSWISDRVKRLFSSPTTLSLSAGRRYFETSRNLIGIAFARFRTSVELYLRPFAKNLRIEERGERYREAHSWRERKSCRSFGVPGRTRNPFAERTSRKDRRRRSTDFWIG
jgi:hypothetical protein